MLAAELWKLNEIIFVVFSNECLMISRYSVILVNIIQFFEHLYHMWSVELGKT